MPSGPVTGLLESLLELSNKGYSDAKERKEVYDLALKLAWAVESEQDTAQRLYHGHLPLAMAQTGIDLNLFKMLSENKDKSFTIEELATKTGTDPVLMNRIMRFYGAQSMIRQTVDGKYTASNITHNLSIPGTAAGIKHYSLTMTPVYNVIPQFLATTAYANPEAKYVPFNLAYKTELPVFEWRKYNPVNAKAGQAFMAAQRMGQKSVWDGQTSMHDFEMSPEDVKAGRIMMCDVGAGFGHQGIDLRKYHPELKGPIIAEDLPLVQNMIPNRDELKALDITLQPHDFTKPQPIKGAKVYYLRNVIHNWGDESSTSMLSEISKVMAEDSVVILDDVVLPEVGATWKQASMDIAMMSMLAAKERTEEEFAKLFTSAGLQLRDIWRYDDDYGDSLIVATPVNPTTKISHVTSPVEIRSATDAPLRGGFLERDSETVIASLSAAVDSPAS